MRLRAVRPIAVDAGPRRGGSDRPAWSSATIALAATPHTARAAIPFLSVLGLGRSVVSWQKAQETGQRPDAFLVTRVELVRGLTGAPAAVFVHDRASLRAAARHDVEVALSHDQKLIDHGAVLVPRAGVDIACWTVRPPEERLAVRRELGLPEDLAVAVDCQRITDDVVAALSLAAAAVVTGPMLPLALALGTPVVTSPLSAERLDLHPDLEALVVTGRRQADAAARALASDHDRAAELSRRGRRFAEHHLDLGHAAGVVAKRLGLPAVEGLPQRGPADVPTVPTAVVADHNFEFTWPEPSGQIDLTVDLDQTPVLRPATIDLAARRATSPSQ